MSEVVTYDDIQRGDIVQQQLGAEPREVIGIAKFSGTDRGREVRLVLKHLHNQPPWFQFEATAEIIRVRCAQAGTELEARQLADVEAAISDVTQRIEVVKDASKLGRLYVALCAYLRRGDYVAEPTSDEWELCRAGQCNHMKTGVGACATYVMTHPPVRVC